MSHERYFELKEEDGWQKVASHVTNIKLIAVQQQVKDTYVLYYVERSGTALPENAREFAVSVEESAILEFNNEPMDIWAMSTAGTANLRIDLGTPSGVMTDRAGRNAVVGTMGELYATDVFNNVIVNFHFGFQPIFVKEGGSMPAQSYEELNGILSAVASAGNNHYIESNDRLRYRSGHTALAHMTITGAVTLDGEVYWGVFEDQAGAAFRYRINDGLSVGFRNGGTWTWKNQSDFNGSYDIDLFDLSINLTACRIQYGYQGINPISFEIRGASGNYEVVHTFDFINSDNRNTPHFSDPHLPVRIESVGNTGTAKIGSGSWQAGVMGLCQVCGSIPQQYDQDQTGIVGGGARTVITSFRLKTTFKGEPNGVAAALTRLKWLAFEATGLQHFEIWANPTYATDPTNWADIETDISIMEYATNGVGITGGKRIFTDHAYPVAGVGATGSTFPGSGEDLEELGLKGVPGNEFAVVLKNDSVDPINLAYAFNWLEKF